MNHIFKTVFNRRSASYVVTSEHAKRNGKAAASKTVVVSAMLAISALAMGDATAERVVISTGETRTIDGSTGSVVENLGGGAVYNEGTVTTKEGSVFSGNSSKKTISGYSKQGAQGGAIYNNAGTLSIYKSSFTENTTNGLYKGSSYLTNNQGGAIYNRAGNIEIEDSEFNGNSTVVYDASGNPRYSYNSNGGAIYHYDSGDGESEIIIKGSKTSFIQNKAGGSGGAIYNDGRKITIAEKAAVFIGNSAHINGGAIANNYKTGVITLNSIEFSNNTAGGYGGAIYNDAGEVKLAGISTFDSNAALDEYGYGYGGAIYNDDRLEIKGAATFNANKADKGGAIWNNGTAVLDGNLQFTGNIAAEGNDKDDAGEKGGAIYNDTRGNLTIGGTADFSGNQSGGNDADINNTGILNFGSEDGTIVHTKTTMTGGVTDDCYGKMFLYSGTLELKGEARIVQGEATFKAGTTTIVNVNRKNDSMVVAEDFATDASDVDSNRLQDAKDNNGWAIYTTNNLTVEPGATLAVKGASLGETYLIAHTRIDISADGWSEKDGEGTLAGRSIESTNKVLKLQRVAGDTDLKTVMVTAIAEEEVNIPEGLAKPVIPGGADPVGELDGDEDGIKDFNSMTDLVSMGGVKKLTYAGGGMFGRALENHLSLSRTLQLEKEGVDLHQEDHKDLWIDLIGSHSSATGGKVTVGGQDKSASNKYGLRADLGGIVVGLDRTTDDKHKHFGVAGMVGTGHAGTKGGNLNHTENDMDFWGLAIYGGWDKDNWNVAGHIAYTNMDSDITQKNKVAAWGNKIKADVDSHMWTAEVRGEYRFDFEHNMALKPHIGLRYDRISTSGFKTKDGNGRVLMKTGHDTMDVWSVPIGLTFEAGLKTDSGWVVRPQADLSLIFSRGDLDDDNKVTMNGVGTYNIENQIIDNQTLSATLGVDMQKGNKSFGLHYNMMRASEQHDNALMARFVYKFE